MDGDKNVHRILWGNVREDRWMSTHRWGRHYRQCLRTLSCCDYTAPVVDSEYEYGIEIRVSMFGISAFRDHPF